MCASYEDISMSIKKVSFVANKSTPTPTTVAVAGV
jgi:hypothetical protein